MTAFSELISRLQQVPQEERSWVTLSMLLETVGSEFASVIWGATVVHWFTPELLTALRPELADPMEGFYQRLRGFQFVRETDEGPRLHEGTRDLLLTRLVADYPQDFQLLSGRAAEYFGQFKDSVSQSLMIYHRLVADPERARRELFGLGSRWLAASRQTEIMGMLQFLDEHVSLGRVSDRAQGDILIWKGKADIKFINTIGILNQRSIFDARDYFDQAFSLYEGAHDHWGMAQAWQGRGDVLLFLDRWEEARVTYEQALDLHQSLDDPRGKMETLKGLGDVVRFLGHSDQAWDCYYRQAIVLSEHVEDQQIRSDLHRLIQAVAQPEKIEDADRSVELLPKKDLEDARPYLDRFHQLCDDQDYESAFDLLTLPQSSNEAAYILDFFLQLRGFNEIRQILWERLLNKWISTEAEHQHKQGYI